MRDLNVPEIEEPERFFPEPKLVRPARWRRLDDGYGEFWREDTQAWERVHPMCVASLEGLEAGVAFQEICARAQPVSPGFSRTQTELTLRKYLWKLATLGHVRFDLEEPPAVFQGRYARVRELGRGGLGVAQLCEDREEGGRLVVVKHPWGVMQDVRRGQRAIAIEIDTMGAFDHDGIVRMWDHFEVRGLLHLVRQYVEGDDLFEHCRRHGVPDRATRLAWTRQVAEAVGHMHERGFLFFDVRPSNYVLDAADGRVRIVDLGNCGPMEGERTPVHGTKGTPGFVSPEVLREGWACPRSDVFGLGRLYYFLCTNKNPKRRWTEAEMRARLVELGMPAEDRVIVETLAADRPEDRPADVRAALDVLV